MLATTRRSIAVSSRLLSRIRRTTGALLLVAVAATAHGSTMVNYNLTNQGSTVVNRIDFNVVPPGSVSPPVVGKNPTTGSNITGSPVTLLPNSTGFDPNFFSVALGNAPSAQILRLLFGQSQTVDANGSVTFAPILDSTGKPIGGFQPGGQLNFAVSVDPATSNRFQLQLPSGTTGLSLTQLPATANPPSSTSPSGSTTNTGTTSTVSTSNNVPEPMSVVVWGGLLGLGLSRFRTLRARARARS
jgi:hypothetical protein